MALHILTSLCCRKHESSQRQEADYSKVLIGFLVTAYLTFAIVGIYYIIGYIPQDSLNSIDRGIIDTVWRKARSKPAKIWEPTLRTAVLMFSDQQLVTGIALLISGYAQLRCGLSVYHWQMIVYLSWFSSLTHLTTLTVLRQYFRENPVPRLWRAILMLLMVTMLMIALLPSGDIEWLGGATSSELVLLPSGEALQLVGIPLEAGLPALCYFRRLVARSPEEQFEFDPYQTLSMLISVMVLFSGYLTRLIKLSNKATAFTKFWIRTKPGRLLKNTLNDSIQRARRPNANKYWRLKHLILETAYVLLRACFDIYESTLWEVRIFSMGLLRHTSLTPLIFSSERADTLAGLCPRLGNNSFAQHSRVCKRS